MGWLWVGAPGMWHVPSMHGRAAWQRSRRHRSHRQHPPPPAAPAAYPQGVGYGISVAAFFVYQRIKMRQLAAESAKPGVAAGGKASPAEAGKAGADLPRYQALPVIEARAGSVPVSPAHKA